VGNAMAFGTELSGHNQWLRVQLHGRALT
jgi:hypothetical protein